MSNLDQYHRHRHGLSDTLAACPVPRLIARPDDEAGPFADRVDQLITDCALPTGARVLDYGCGAGHATDRLAQALGGTALGVDSSLPMIREAATTGRTRFAHTPNGVVPAGRQHFDVVHAALVLGGLSGRNLTRAVTELLRVLKPGGLLLLIDAAGETTGRSRWNPRPADAYRTLFPGVGLAAEAAFDDGGDRLVLLAGRLADAGPAPTPLTKKERPGKGPLQER